ncbi:uncharacterized protein G2W53_004623 [Senna tora]|uniref:Uncharacterized protein n=1 Tax=Senna tora TaxID=362788 RepID=A0A835CJI4_9FABA|nr:uncharacterized protein G2W53_004623 [Senna tora]
MARKRKGEKLYLREWREDGEAHNGVRAEGASEYDTQRAVKEKEHRTSREP